MKNLSSLFVRSSNQHGLVVIEFAYVAIPFFLLLFGAMEFSRLMYLWNTVQEVTRNAARQAVVTDFNNSAAIEAIKRAAVFRSTDGYLPASFEISNANVNIKYLNASGNNANPMPNNPGDNISACMDSGRINSCIRFVEVSVCTEVVGQNETSCVPVLFSPITGLFSKNSIGLVNLEIPLSTIRMPTESLGFKPF
jgi:hypothetical protein